MTENPLREAAATSTSRWRGRLHGWRGEARSLSYLLGGEATSRLLGQVCIVWAARRLGPTEYGVVGVSLAVYSILLVIVDLGVGDSSIARLSARADGLQRFRSEVAGTRLLTSLAMVLPIAVVVLLTSDSVAWTVSALLCLALPVTMVISSRSLMYRIGERFRPAAAWNATLLLCQYVGALLGSFVQARAGWAVVGILVCLHVSGVVAMIHSPMKVPSLSVARSWLVRGMPFAVIAISVALYSRGDRVVLAFFVSSANVGYYAAAYSLVMIAAVAGASMQAVLMPRLIRDSQDGSGPRWAFRCRLLLTVGTCAAVVVVATAPWIVRLTFGEAYGPAALVLRLLSPLIPLYLTNSFLGATLIASGRQRTLMWVAVSNLAVAVVAYPLCGWLGGTSAMAVASVLVEVMGISQIWWVLSRADRAEARTG